MTSHPPGIRSVWALSEGHAGMANQAKGLAQALGVTPTVKNLWPRGPWRWLPPRFWPFPLRSPGPEGDPLEPPWPDILISCGKRAVAPAIAVKKASGGKTFTVHIQQPRVPAERFDLVVVPRHDKLRGPNVFVTEAAVHHVTPALIEAAVTRLGGDYTHLPRPLIAVLIGGNNNRYRLTPEITGRVAGQLADLAMKTGGGLLVTPSRRTGRENEAILQEVLADVPASVWDGTGENPYFAFLGLADYIVVTCDSVSMASEAASTGKPLYVIQLEGHSRRIEAFHAHLRECGIAKRFEGDLEHWTYSPPADTERAAEEIRKLYAERRSRAE